jgi:hypothetical protein
VGFLWNICCGTMHIVHNLRNILGTAYTKCRARPSDRHLKSCHSDHLLWDNGSSLTFVRGTLTDHFSRENDRCSRHDRNDRLPSIMFTEEAYRRTYRVYPRSYRTCRADMCARLCIAIHMYRQTKLISVHPHVHTCTKWICR